MAKQYSIREQGYEFTTVKALDAEHAFDLALEETTIRAADYNCEVGDGVEIEWAVFEGGEYCGTYRATVEAE